MEPEGTFHIAQEDMIVYKQVVEVNFAPGKAVYDRRAIISLRIPKGTRYFDGYGATWSDEKANKCRAERAIVCQVPDTSKTYVSCYESGKWDGQGGDRAFYYVEGNTVFPRSSFSDHPSCCGSGIHFFKTEGEALNYKI